jgi:hypothetical protein
VGITPGSIGGDLEPFRRSDQPPARLAKRFGGLACSMTFTGYFPQPNVGICPTCPCIGTALSIGR